MTLKESLVNTQYNVCHKKNLNKFIAKIVVTTNVFTSQITTAVSLQSVINILLRLI